MSRSIHSTRQTLDKTRRQQYADPANKVAAIRRERRALIRKRLIKSQARRQSADARRGLALDGTPVDVITIPVEIVAGGDPRFVHHTASPEELRALLAALPAGTADGLSRVVCTLGKRDIAARKADDWSSPDPLTGRLGGEVFPGIYAGRILGVYRPATATIQLNAYVYDRTGRSPGLPWPLCELYLRLQALTTFVHEVAHHFDEVRRVARGRWLARGTRLVEAYAEAREWEWTLAYAVPLLRRLYPEEVRDLEGWIAHHGGLKMPLEWLVRAPAKDAAARRAEPPYDLCSAFEWWVSEMSAPPTDLFASRQNFAWHLHYGDQYAACLLVIDGLLADFPPTAKTWSFRADTLVHLERWDEAAADAARALELDPDLLDAWEQLGWVAIARHDWFGLLTITRRQQNLVNPAEDRVEWRRIMFQRAVALCGLGEFARMETCLVASVMCRSRLAKRRAAVYRFAGLEDQAKLSTP